MADGEDEAALRASIGPLWKAARRFLVVAPGQEPEGDLKYIRPSNSERGRVEVTWGGKRYCGTFDSLAPAARATDLLQYNASGGTEVLVYPLEEYH